MNFSHLPTIFFLPSNSKNDDPVSRTFFFLYLRTWRIRELVGGQLSVFFSFFSLRSLRWGWNKTAVQVVRLVEDKVCAREEQNPG